MKRDKHGDRYVAFGDLRAYPQGGGYWALQDKDGTTLMCWVSAKRIRQFIQEAQKEKSMPDNSKLDLTRCRLGQIVPLRDGREAVYLRRNDDAEPHFRHHLTVWDPFTCSDAGRVLPFGKTGTDVIGAWDAYRFGGTLTDFVFGVSNDGGKTVVAVRNHIDDAMAYLALQNRNGVTDYAVVVIPKRKESEHE